MADEKVEDGLENITKEVKTISFKEKTVSLYNKTKDNETLNKAVTYTLVRPFQLAVGAITFGLILLFAYSITPEAKENYDLRKNKEASAKTADSLDSVKKLKAGIEDSMFGNFKLDSSHTTHPSFWAVKGEVEAEHILLEDAIDSYYKAVEVEPNNANYLFSLGEAYGWDKQTNNALYYLDKAIEIKPDYTEAKEKIAMFLNQKNLNKAAKQYIEGLDQKDMTGFLWDQKGLAEWGLDSLDSAIMSFQNAIEKEPNNYKYWDHLGVMYSHIGEKEKEEEAFAKSKELFDLMKENAGVK